MGTCSLCPRVMTETDRLARELDVHQRIEALRALNGFVQVMETWQVGALIGEARQLLLRAEALPIFGLETK